MNGKDIGFAVLVALIWGLNFPVVKVGLEELPPLLFTAVRFALASIPAVFFVPLPQVPWFIVVTIGLLLGVFKFGLLFLALESNISAGLASLLMQAQVLFTILLSCVFLREPIRRRQWAGLILCMAGFVLFLLVAGGSVTVVGIALILGSASAWALSNVLTKQLKQVNVVHLTVWMSIVAPIPLAVLSWFTETTQPLQVLAQAGLSTWLAVIYTSYGATLVAVALWALLLRRHAAATVTPFALLIPVVGMGSSALWLGERLELSESIGAALILIGLAVITWHVPRRASTSSVNHPSNRSKHNDTLETT
ncbi:MAG: EamA family transporter [Pseudomonadota bacterium]